jgi:hypothetical protein
MNSRSLVYSPWVEMDGSSEELAPQLLARHRPPGLEVQGRGRAGTRRGRSRRHPSALALSGIGLYNRKAKFAKNGNIFTRV